MKCNVWQSLATVSIVLPALLAAGCTGSDLLTTGNASVRFEVMLEGSPGTEYDCVNTDLSSVRVRPLDGRCDPGGQPCSDTTQDCPVGTCVGSQAAGIIDESGGLVIQEPGDSQAVVSNLLGVACDPTKFCAVAGTVCETVADCPVPTPPAVEVCAAKFNGITVGPFQVPPSTTLVEGLWVVNELTLTSIRLYDDQPTPTLRGCSSPLDVADALGSLLRFTIPATGEKVVRIVLDVGVLEAALTSADSCPADVAAFIRDAVRCDSCDAAVSP